MIDDHPHDPDDMSHRALFWWSAFFVTLALLCFALLSHFMPVFLAIAERYQ